MDMYEGSDEKNNNQDYRLDIRDFEGLISYVEDVGKNLEVDEDTKNCDGEIRKK